jgi:hypothetical protein
MVHRFKLFRYEAKLVHHWNTHIPSDPKKAAIYIQKREEANLLLSKGQDVSGIDEWHVSEVAAIAKEDILQRERAFNTYVPAIPAEPD